MTTSAPLRTFSCTASRFWASDRPTAVGAVYAALERLEGKRYIHSREAETTRGRGSLSKTYYEVTASGKRAVRQTQAAFRTMEEGTERVLGSAFVRLVASLMHAFPGGFAAVNRQRAGPTHRQTESLRIRTREVLENKAQRSAENLGKPKQHRNKPKKDPKFRVEPGNRASPSPLFW